MNGVERIAAERQRQLEFEGWTDAHDAEHAGGELSRAASCYALASEGDGRVPDSWPWHRAWWKPTTSIRNLEKAGALIAAEIDRLLALKEKP